VCCALHNIKGWRRQCRRDMDTASSAAELTSVCSAASTAVNGFSIQRVVLWLILHKISMADDGSSHACLSARASMAARVTRGPAGPKRVALELPAGLHTFLSSWLKDSGDVGGPAVC
jgi:hypothetical protein